MKWTNGISQSIIKFINEQNYLPIEFEYEKKCEFPNGKNIVFISNHSGWFALDGVIIGNYIFDDMVQNYKDITGKKDGEFKMNDIMSVVVHDMIKKFPVKYMFPKTALDMMIPRKEYRKILEDSDRIKELPSSFCIFPEGEAGSIKPFTQAYKIKTFKPGFIHHAIKTKSDVVVMTTIGNEELFPSICEVKLSFSKNNKRPVLISIPMPPILNPISFISFLKASKYKVTCHEVVSYENIIERIENGETVEEIASWFQKKVQRYVDEEAYDRPLRLASKYLDRYRKDVMDLTSFSFNISF